jgi:hypothetical protein
MKKYFLVLFVLFVIYNSNPIKVGAAIVVVPNSNNSTGCIAGLSCLSLTDVIFNVINYITIILTGLFVLMVLVGGVMMMTLTPAEKQEEGKEVVKWAVIGAVVSILAWTVFNAIRWVLVVGF